MCCLGCKAVAEAIVNGGMESFYNFRTENTGKARELVPEFLDQLRSYDNPVVQKQFVHDRGDLQEVSLILEGIVCAACVWLNEQHLKSLPGVIEVGINYSNHRARVVWNRNQTTLSAILEAISRIGYLAHPYDPDRQQRILEKERKQQLRRIGLAGVLGMQVMILAVALYTGEWWGIEASFREFFRWTSLLVTVPVLVFASRTFFTAAWRDLRNKRAGMDVPVALGIGIAFSASVFHTVTGTGAIYYDSVVMFTFFLLSARYFEMTARKRASETTEAMVSLQPAVATRLTIVDGRELEQAVPVAELVEGDRVLVLPGDTVPADGMIESGASGINESLMTGESMPVTRKPGDDVIGGSINTENPLVVRIEHVGADTVLAAIQRLLDKAQSEKPAIAQLADRIASRFVLAILSVAAAVAAYWYLRGDSHWLPITVATLVVTCPCALSLATPAAITAASGRLAGMGLLPTRGHALETLAQASHFCFDKTGTLTEGSVQLKRTIATGSRNADECLQLASALEARSEHPIARSFKTALPAVGQDRNVTATDLVNAPGNGVSGKIDNVQWYLGNPDYVAANCRQPIPEAALTDAGYSGQTVVVLATGDETAALFTLDDVIRPGAAKLVTQLIKAGKQVVLLTGDNSRSAEQIALQLGIEQVFSNLKPEQKLAHIRELQSAGAVVAMVGDGINDAPVLAGADVSIAMGAGSQLAAASADIILLSNRIGRIYSGYLLAGKTLTIIRENLVWAIGYNIIAVPAAAMGYIEPWLAAIGMSTSSLIVVLNALRLSGRNK
jgi:Cu2+-exporting ATPase